MAKIKRPQFRAFESSKPKTDRYIKLTASLWQNPNFNKLKPTSRVLYIHMLLFARGKDTIDYALSIACQDTGFNTNTVRNGLKELVDVGLLERINGNRYAHIPDAYKFSSNWYTK